MVDVAQPNGISKPREVNKAGGSGNNNHRNKENHRENSNSYRGNNRQNTRSPASSTSTTSVVTCSDPREGSMELATGKLASLLMAGSRLKAPGSSKELSAARIGGCSEGPSELATPGTVEIPCSTSEDLAG